MSTTKAKKKIIVFSIVGAVLLLLIGAICIYYFGASYDFYNHVQVEAKTPGLDDGFVPQGMCVVDNADAYLVSGYMKDTSMPSRIYYVNKTTGESKYVTMNAADEKMCKGHFGGIAMQGNSVWLVSDGYLFYFSLTDIASAENASSLVFDGCFNVGIDTAFCYAKDSKLYVGEFYRAGNYEVDQSHYVTSQTGQVNHAIMAVYEINEASIYGLKSTVPTMAVSIPDQVQGFCISASGKYIFSTSYSLPDSIIYLFNKPIDAGKTVTINDNQIPVYAVFNEQLQKTIIAPCMAEGIDYDNGRVHIVFENACAKYKLFTRVRETNILSFEVE